MSCDTSTISEWIHRRCTMEVKVAKIEIKHTLCASMAYQKKFELIQGDFQGLY